MKKSKLYIINIYHLYITNIISSEYHYVDENFWDEEFGEKVVKKGRNARIPREPRPTGTKRGVDRESIIAKYKIMQVQVQDRNGNYFTIKKRVSNMDPSLPTYVKIPARPISRSWAHKILPKSEISVTVPGSKYYEVENVVETDLTQYGQEFSAVYMDPPLLLPDEEPCQGKITIDQFVGSLPVIYVYCSLTPLLFRPP